MCFQTGKEKASMPPSLTFPTFPVIQHKEFSMALLQSTVHIIVKKMDGLGGTISVQYEIQTRK